MSLILSIETSTDVCSVALHREGMLVATAEIHLSQSHAAKLAVMTNEVMKLAGVQYDEIKAVAISSGPGSYTGLRIGTSTAKGLCFALNIPLIAVGTLELMIHQVMSYNISEACLCAMIDARRMEVYCLLADAKMNKLSSVEAKIIDEASFAGELSMGRIIFFGNGAPKCKEVIRHLNAVFLDNIYPSASALGIIAYKRWKENKFEHLDSYEPFYLKEFVAKTAKAQI